MLKMNSSVPVVCTWNLMGNLMPGFGYGPKKAAGIRDRGRKKKKLRDDEGIFTTTLLHVTRFKSSVQISGLLYSPS